MSKNVKKCQNCQKKIIKMLDRSCFLITLIKCLKGHKSLGSLCNVTKVKVTQSVSQWQGHLLSCCGQLKSNEGLSHYSERGAPAKIPHPKWFPPDLENSKDVKNGENIKNSEQRAGNSSEPPLINAGLQYSFFYRQFMSKLKFYCWKEQKPGQQTIETHVTI